MPALSGLLMNACLLFAGALGIGFVSAIAGIGGGSLLVPFLVLVLGYDVKVAIATSLVCIIVTSASAASIYLGRGMVDLGTALLIEPSTVLGAIVGAYVTLTLPATYVRFALGLVLLYISATMLKESLIGTKVGETKITKVSKSRKVVGVSISFIAGMFSGMFGIGGGVIKVPLLNLIMGLPIKTAVATSSFMVGLTATSGGAVYLARGLTDPLSVAIIALGIMPGATLGAKCLRRLKPRIVRLVFSLVLLYASIRLLITALI